MECFLQLETMRTSKVTNIIYFQFEIISEIQLTIHCMDLLFMTYSFGQTKFYHVIVSTDTSVMNPPTPSKRNDKGVQV
jgi:hypothetical protein